jgi:hypothetical protein
MYHPSNKPGSVKQTVYLSAFIMALIAQGCEFDSRDDNFHPVQQPPAEIQIGIDLAGVNPYDTIYAYNYTCFHYSLDAGTREVVAQQFFMDGKEVNTDPINGYACIEAAVADNEVHDLTVNMIIRSGSGSLADYAGYENYLGEFSFQVKVLDDEFEEMHLTPSFDENNHLKLTWDKPAGYGDISGYEIYSGQQLLATINNPNITSWVDTDYAYGYKDYQVKAKVTNSWDVTINDAVTAPHAILLQSDLNFERTSFNQLRIKWNNPNPYPCKYVIRQNSGAAPIYVEEGTTEAIIPVGAFPVSYTPLNLYIIPSGAAYENYEKYSYVSATYSDARLSYGITFEPDVYRNRFLTLGFDNVTTYSISDMSQLNTASHHLQLSTGSELKVGKAGNIAISEAYGKIHVFNNANLTSKLFTADTHILTPFCLTENGLLLVHAGSGFRLYDVNTGNQVLSKDWENSPDPYYPAGSLTASISRDGKYIFVICNQYDPQKEWTDLYELKDDFTLNLLQNLPDTKISQIVFHPLDPQLAIVQYENGTFGMINVDGQILKTVSGKFLNIDPFTGNILYKQADYSSPHQVKVLDSNFNRILYQLEIANWGNDEIRLYNNLLFYASYYAPIYNLAPQN